MAVLLNLPASDLSALQAFARRLAWIARPGDAILLEGEMGAGKTAFAQAFIKAIAAPETEVTSPTFALMQPYEVKLGSGAPEVLWHLDLYRLKEARELDALGLDELLPHILLVEWPRLAMPLLGEDGLTLTVSFGIAPGSRDLTLSGNEAWRGRLEPLA